jgi:hypothetical protein
MLYAQKPPAWAAFVFGAHFGRALIQHMPTTSLLLRPRLPWQLGEACRGRIDLRHHFRNTVTRKRLDLEGLRLRRLD